MSFAATTGPAIPPNALAVINNTQVTCNVTTFDPYLASQGQSIPQGDPVQNDGIMPMPNATTQSVPPGASVLVTPPLSVTGQILPKIGLLWAPVLASQTLPRLWRSVVAPNGGIQVSLCQVPNTNHFGAVLGSSSCKNKSTTPPPPPTRPPTRPAPRRSKPAPLKPAGPIPYDAWPDWAKGLLWAGVSVIGVLSIIAIIVGVRHKRMTAAATL